MKNLLFVLCLTTAFNIKAQTTAIPDSNFEQALINLGYDTVPINGSVLTSNISGVTYLDVFNKNISDLTGIEDFTALTYLYCGGNLLTSLDVTQNTALTYLYCGGNLLTSLDVTQNTALTSLGSTGNLLTSLDVTQNTALTDLYCGGNQLTSIDVTQNTALTYLYCAENQLTSLDVTQNTALTGLYCEGNQLMCLNMKNGNNSNFIQINITNNPNLNCIEVDDVAYSNANWSSFIDAQTSFSTSCPNPCAVGIGENNLSSLSLYPNPTAGFITIDLEETKSNINLSLTNAIGQVILTESYKSNNYINLEIDAPKGLYFLRLETDGEVITKKIIKE